MCPFRNHDVSSFKEGLFSFHLIAFEFPQMHFLGTFEQQK